jgi:hypothetical protein
MAPPPPLAKEEGLERKGRRGGGWRMRIGGEGPDRIRKRRELECDMWVESIDVFSR